MRKLPSWILIVIIPILLFIFSYIEYSQNLALEYRLGESYYNTVNCLHAEASNLRVYLIDDRDHINKELLVTLYHQLFAIEQQLEADPKRIPMRKNYYGVLFRSLREDVAALTAALYEGTEWIDKEYVLWRIKNTCDKMEWSFAIIIGNAEKRGGIYGYFKELYYRNSRTHQTVDGELERYLLEELRIGM